jgi:hypothetical protein
MESSVFELLDLPTVVEEYLDTYDDGRPEATIASELLRRCVTPRLYLYAERAVLVTPLGIRAYTRSAEPEFAGSARD